LHDYIYQDASFNSFKEYINFIKLIDDTNYAKFEWQANQFAGYLLVPSIKLYQEFIKLIRSDPIVIDDISINPAMGMITIINKLSDVFKASSSVTERRLSCERISL